MAKCKSKIIFKINKPLIYSIQKITGHHTHQIMTFMTESLNAFLQEFDIDMTDTKSTFNLDEEGNLCLMVVTIAIIITVVVVIEAMLEKLLNTQILIF